MLITSKVFITIHRINISSASFLALNKNKWVYNRDNRQIFIIAIKEIRFGLISI